MIITIINLVCLVTIIAVVIFLVLTYNAIKKDIDVMSKIVPEADSITNKLTNISVPSGPKNQGAVITQTNSANFVAPVLSPVVSMTPTNYVPPDTSMKRYYEVLKPALDIFERSKDVIMKLVSSSEFYNSKGEAAQKYLKDNNVLVPMLAWYIYENSVSKTALNQKDIDSMYTALDYYNNDAYKYKSATGVTIHFGTLSYSSSFQQFYQNNKAYLDKCIAENTCLINKSPTYVPPDEYMRRYYEVLVPALDTFKNNKDLIVKLVSSPDFYSLDYNLKGEAAKKYLKDNKVLIPMFKLFVFQINGYDGINRNEDIYKMEVAVDYYNDAYTFKSENGENYHFSVLLPRFYNFYHTNKEYIDKCIAENTC